MYVYIYTFFFWKIGFATKVMSLFHFALLRRLISSIYDKVNTPTTETSDLEIFCIKWFTQFTTQKIFQKCFNVVLCLMWHRDVVQRQINFETTLRTSTLKSATLNNVQSRLAISTLIWTMLDKVKYIHCNVANISLWEIIK